MQINLEESITILAKRVERLRELNSRMEIEVKIRLDRVREALAQVESLLTPRAADGLAPSEKSKSAAKHARR